jgi:hypothetical protein
MFHLGSFVTAFAAIVLLITSCTGDQPLDIASRYNGYLVVATDPSSVGRVAMFDPKGKFVRSLYELTGGNYASGHAFLAPNELFVFIETPQVFDRFNLDNWSEDNVFTNVVGGSPVRQVAISQSDNSIYFVIGNHNCLTKATRLPSGGYTSLGLCSVPNSGSCVMNNPVAITWIPPTNQVAVTSVGAGQGVSIFNSDGSCVRQISAAPLNSGQPMGITYHSLSGKLIVSLNTLDEIYSMDLDGSNLTQIFLDSSLIDVPRGLTSDRLGNIYVGNATQDTIEKLYYSGTGVATRVGTSPFIPKNAYTLNPSQITVIE